MSDKSDDPVKAVPALTVVKTGVQAAEKSNQLEQSAKFLHRLVNHPDQDLAREIIEKQAALEADEAYGEDITRCEMAKTDLEDRYQALNIELKELEKQRAGTAPYIKNVEDE